MPTNLSVKDFIKQSNIVLDEAIAALPPHNPPALINYDSGYTPSYWYNKLHLSDIERRFNLPSKLLLHLIDIESKGDPNAVSKRGARGLFGIMPSHISGYTGNINNPAETAVFVAKTLRELADTFGGYEKALAAYNWGRGHLAKHGLRNAPYQTRNYINHFKKKGVLGNKYAANSWGEEDFKDSWE